MSENKPLVLLCGKTASGKSSIALYCYQTFGLTTYRVRGKFLKKEDADILVLNGTDIKSVRETYKDRKITVVYVTAAEDPHKAFGELYERMRTDGKSAEEASMTVAYDNFRFRGMEEEADRVAVNADAADIVRNAEAINEILRGDNI